MKFDNVVLVVILVKIKKGFRYSSEAFCIYFWHTTSVLLFEEVKVTIEKIEPRCHFCIQLTGTKIHPGLEKQYQYFIF
jgi:hypothetical protein